MTQNLLAETRDHIAHSGHTPDDVVFIGSDDGKYRMTWDEFVRVADVEYDDGYGSAKVATDLIIRFADGRKMWRHEYDGSECWHYDNPGVTDYTQPGKPIARLVGGLWPTVSELQNHPES